MDPRYEPLLKIRTWCSACVSREASFKNLVLNMRVEADSPFVTPQQWKACGGEPLLDLTFAARESRHSVQ
jgi:hypothetical protein